MSEQDDTQATTKRHRSHQTSKQNGSQISALQCPTSDDKEAWIAYWKAQSQPWRTEPEIDTKRQKYLDERRAFTPDIEQGFYPFKGIKLSRADIEWLLATHENGRGPIDWGDENQRERLGLDLRGADLRGTDLRSLPLACMRGSLNENERRGMTEDQCSMARVHLESAILYWAHLENAMLIEAHLERADLASACLKQAHLLKAHMEGVTLDNVDAQHADLRGAYLEGANLPGAHLEGAYLRFAWLHGAVMHFAYFQESDLRGAHLAGARLNDTHLEGACLEDVHLEGTELGGNHLERLRSVMPLFVSRLPPSDLSGVFFNDMTVLKGAIFGERKFGSVSLADIHWGGANLSAIDWSSVQQLGDEREARRLRKSLRSKNETEQKSSDLFQLLMYRKAVRANRQLAAVLRSQGLNEEADHFAYRAHLLQRVVWHRQRRPLKFVLSWFLYLLAGYGYRPLMSIIIYLLVVFGFAVGYYQGWSHFHLEHITKHSLSFVGAIIFSITAFHGRGFFLGGDLGYDSLITILGAVEAVIGLLIELSFIATFTQRFFGK